MKLADADGIGLALPIEYALPPAEDGHAREWQALLGKAADSEEHERSKLAERTRKPWLAGLDLLPEGEPGVVVVQRFEGGPHAELHLLDVVQDGVVRCTGRARFAQWMALGQALPGAGASRAVQWLRRTEAARSLYAGAAPLDLGGCPDEVATRSATLVLRESDEEHARLRIEPEELRLALRRGPSQQRARAAQQRDSELRRDEEVRRDDQLQRQSAESAWRAAFSDARQRIRQLEQQSRSARAELEAVGRPMPPALYAQRRARAARLEQQWARARDELRELERRAALGGIPLEWRR
jgi:hypothetical protein